MAVSAPSETTVERRQHYRHRCNHEIMMRMVLVDLSVSGAQLEVGYPVPPESRIGFALNSEDALLRSLTAKVLYCREVAPGAFRLHVQFGELPQPVQRALQKHLLALQMADVRTRRN